MKFLTRGVKASRLFLQISKENYLMNLPESDYQILKLTNAFYRAYPNPPYTEILKKDQRAYNCLLFQSHYDYFICIPYRSEITHKYAFIKKIKNFLFPTATF